MSLVLRKLTLSDELAFLAGAKCWDGQPLYWYTFDWKPEGSYIDMLEKLDRDSKGIDLAPGRVPATMLYGFVEDKIVGRLHVRHCLNDELTRRGGNIGYAVSPEFRGRSYATQMMAQGIDFCRDLNMKKILVTCADTNIASWKIIEKFGGVLENKFLDEKDGQTIRRYWI